MVCNCNLPPCSPCHHFSFNPPGTRILTGLGILNSNAILVCLNNPTGSIVQSVYIQGPILRLHYANITHFAAVSNATPLGENGLAIARSDEWTGSCSSRCQILSMVRLHRVQEGVEQSRVGRT